MRDATSRNKEVEKLELESWWSDFRNLRIWRTNFRSEVSSCARRPIEAMVWINEIESAKFIAELKTSKSITGAALKSNLEVLDTQIASGVKNIINGDFERSVFIHKKAAQIEKRFLIKRQVGCMIYGYFKVSDSDESVSDFND